MRWHFWMLFFFSVSADRSSNQSEDNYESRLYNELVFRPHVDRYSRPVRHHGEVVTVQTWLKIHDIMSAPDNSDILTFNGFMLMRWKDLNFTWNPNNYGGLRHINIPDFYLWKPDVVLLNSIQTRDDFSYRSRSYIRIQATGHLEWNPPVTLPIRCPMDLRVFPFDEHFCKLKFGSLNYLAEHLNVTLGKDQFPIEETEPSEWNVVNWTPTAVYEYKQLPRIEYQLHLRRRAPYYAYAILLPVLVLLIASLAVFWLPPDAGEKITLSGFVCLLLLVLLIHLYWVIPRSGTSVPGVVVLCGNAVGFVGFSLILSVITIGLTRMPHVRPVPDFIQNLLSGLCGKLLCLGSQSSQFGHTAFENARDSVSDPINEPKHEPQITDWHLLALAIDRISFIIYSFSFIILCIVCLV